MSVTDVIVVAAGSGRRMGGATPKAFLPLAGRPLLLHSLELLTGLAEIREVVVVVPLRQESETHTMIKTLPHVGKVRAVVVGGARRQDSVHRGLDHIAPGADVVLIHDAARPFTSPELVRRVISATVQTGAAVPGIPVADTLKRVRQGLVETTVERRDLVAVQTPQGFKYDWLKRIYQQAWSENFVATDDAGLAEHLGLAVAVVEGEVRNFKLTTPQDWVWAEKLITQT